MQLKPLTWYKDLADAKGRLEARAFLVEGPRAVKQITCNHPEDIMEIIYSGQLPDEFGDFPAREITEKQLNSICSSRTPQQIAAVVRLPVDAYSPQLPVKPGASILLLEDIQDPGNIGTLIRTAVAFGYSGAILTGKCADPFSPKCVQSTAGTVLSLWIRRTDGYLEFVKELKDRGYNLISTDLSGKEDISVLQQAQNLVLALGNEAAGLSKAILQMSDYRLRIPITRSRAESLNVAACGAICMFLSRHDQCAGELK